MARHLRQLVLPDLIAPFRRSPGFLLDSAINIQRQERQRPLDAIGQMFAEWRDQRQGQQRTNHEPRHEPGAVQSLKVKLKAKNHGQTNDSRPEPPERYQTAKTNE